MKALDNIYRDKWQEYRLADGRTFDSRQTNWRDAEWEKVISVTTYIKGARHKIGLADKPGFIAFMVFRWGGFDGAKMRPINIWTVGWTNGNECFLQDIDFKTGAVEKQYVAPLKQFAGHLHPRIKNTMGDIRL